MYYTEPVVRIARLRVRSQRRHRPVPVRAGRGNHPAEGRHPAPPARARIPFLDEYAKAHGVPLEAARGGAETMYPEYRKKLAAMPKTGRSRQEVTRTQVQRRVRRVSRSSRSEACAACRAAAEFRQRSSQRAEGAGQRLHARRRRRQHHRADRERGRRCSWTRSTRRCRTRSWRPIRTLSQGPIRYIINTHSHGDHVGGNENLKKAGARLPAAT